MPPIAPALITGLSGLFGNAFNAQSQQGINSQSLAFQREMYERQRQDALADWDRNNQYNSPQEQMRRLKEAGLNPNLVYGSGAVGNSASPIRSSSAGSPNLSPIRVDPSFIGDSINTYFNVQKQKAEIDILDQQEKLMKSQETLNVVKAITENEKPSLVRSQTKLADTNSVLADTKQQNLQFQTYTGQQLLQGRINLQNQLVQKAQQDIATSKSQESLNDSRTLTENQLRTIRVANILQTIATQKAVEEKNYAAIPLINTQIAQLKNNIASYKLDGGVNLGVFGKWGVSREDKGKDSKTLLQQLEEMNNKFKKLHP